MRNKKKFLLSSFIFFISISISITNTEANTPADMVLSYNTNTQMLSVTITHNVGTPTTHFIENVEVRVNDSTVIDQAYTSQPTDSTFTYTYNIVANTGATIFVRAICNISGSISRTIIVGDNTPQNPAIPGFIGYLWILALMLSIAILIIYRKSKVKF